MRLWQKQWEYKPSERRDKRQEWKNRGRYQRKVKKGFIELVKWFYYGIFFRLFGWMNLLCTFIIILVDSLNTMSDSPLSHLPKLNKQYQYDYVSVLLGYFYLCIFLTSQLWWALKKMWYATKMYTKNSQFSLVENSHFCCSFQFSLSSI